MNMKVSILTQVALYFHKFNYVILNIINIVTCGFYIVNLDSTDYMSVFMMEYEENNAHAVLGGVDIGYNLILQLT